MEQLWPHDQHLKKLGKVALAVAAHQISRLYDCDVRQEF